MNPTLLAIIELLIGTAENIVPLFIHNPKSNAIEGVIATVVNSVMEQGPVALAPPAPKAPVAPIPAPPAQPSLTPFKAI